MYWILRVKGGGWREGIQGESGYENDVGLKPCVVGTCGVGQWHGNSHGSIVCNGRLLL